MRTKLCVLGAVLGSASLLPGVCVPSLEDAHRTNDARQPEGRVSRRILTPAGPALQAPLPADEAPRSPASPGPMHPCELITVMQVPCDPAATTCEYTYWECPGSVTPLQA